MLDHVPGVGHAALREPLEALEGVVDEHPVLVGLATLTLTGWCSWKCHELRAACERANIMSITYLYWYVRELVKVARVIDGPNLDGDGSGPVPDVLPVHAPEPGPALDVLQTLDPILTLSTKPAKNNCFIKRFICRF